MKFSLTIIFLALATGAVATPSPYPGPPLVPGSDDTAIYLGPSGVMLEADYFNYAAPASRGETNFPQPAAPARRTCAADCAILRLKAGTKRPLFPL